jgi:hypothetical protein
MNPPSIDAPIDRGYAFLSERRKSSGHFSVQVTHHYQSDKILEDSAFFLTTQVLHPLQISNLRFQI